MKTNKIITSLLATTLIATCAVFAEEGGGFPGNSQGGGPGPMGGQGMGREHPPRGQGGFFSEMLGSFRGERQEMRQEFRDDKQEIRDQFKNDMQERREWMMGSTTPGMATPTPWKNMRGNMKDLREEMRGKMASLTEAQMASITAKLGITIDQLKLQLASGTPLRQIVGNKISPEDMRKIMPPPVMASGTMATNTRPMFDNERRGERGFFNSMRQRLFGQNGENENPDFSQGNNPDNQPEQGIRNFFRRLFNF